MGRRLIIIVLGIIATVALVLWVGPRDPETGLDWDPVSTKPNGAKVLITLLKELGMPTEITRSVPEEVGPPILLLYETPNEDQVLALRKYAEKGGTVVQAASDSMYLYDADTDHIAQGPAGFEKTCDWPELADVNRVRIEDARLIDPAENKPASPTSVLEGCFVRGKHAWLIRETIGKGKIYTLSGGNTFLNKYIEADDNVMLAIRLLEEDGMAHRRVLRYKPSQVETPAIKNPLTYVPNWGWVAFGHLLFTFAFLVYWRLIRPGKVIRETLMTQLPGSTPVLAFGHYLWSTKRIGAVTQMARQDLIAKLVRQLAISDSQMATMSEVVAQNVQWPKEKVDAVLFGPEPSTRKDLFNLVLDIAKLDEAMAAGTRSNTE